jgi:hypothetical protein
MLDFDLAEPYETETRILNQAVKRNIARFPADFMFQLTETEFNYYSSQFVMSSSKHRGVKYLSFAMIAPLGVWGLKYFILWKITWNT